MTKKKNNKFLTFFAIFFTSFLLGFVVSFIYREKVEFDLLKNRLYSLKTENYGSGKLNISKLYRAYDLIEKNYYDFDELNKKKLIDGIISGLVSSLGDVHSEYFNIEDNSNFTEILDQEFEGIGAIVGVDPLGIKLESIFKNSPAEKSGLLVGDIIVSADSVKLAGLEQKEAISHIKGPAGTKVILEISRDSKKDLIKKEVIRNKVEIPSVEAEILDGNIGYINLTSFGDKTANELKKSLKEVKDTDGIIIDLRNNGGGYLEIAVEVLSNFIENGEKLVTTKTKGKKVGRVLQSHNLGNIYNGKIVILINEISASASEITAGALRDYNKAIIVGKKSYGKGSVQIPYPLGDGSMVKITVAKWFTPKDKNIDGEGIKPDIEVDFEKQDYKNNYDRQKEEAIKILKNFIQKGALQITIDEYNNSVKN